MDDSCAAVFSSEPDRRRLIALDVFSRAELSFDLWLTGEVTTGGTLAAFGDGGAPAIPTYVTSLRGVPHDEVDSSVKLTPTGTSSLVSVFTSCSAFMCVFRSWGVSNESRVAESGRAFAALDSESSDPREDMALLTTSNEKALALENALVP